MRPILAVMVGISGSGKSTFAHGLKTSFNAELVETDAIRVELTGNAGDQTQNGRVFGVAKKRVGDFLAQGKNAIIDATSITPKDRRDWINIGRANNAEIKAYFMSTSGDVAKKRNASRDRQVPDWVIDRQLSKLIPPTRSEGFDAIVRI